MARTIRFHLDEHVSNAVAEGLRRRGMNVTTTADAGLLGADDSQHIAFALAQDRVSSLTTTTFYASTTRATITSALLTVTSKVDRSVRSFGFSS
jgi:hypothetical protein